MGGEPWYYYVPYQPDINKALQELRLREFKAGRYNPVIPFQPHIITGAPPGAQHGSIEEALEASDADGTRSILDMERVGTEPDYGVVVPLAGEELRGLFGTEQPSHEAIDKNMDFFEDIERGQGIYIVVYKDGAPSEIFFAGYSYD